MTPSLGTEPVNSELNSAARLVTKTKKRDHITPVLRKLHWLTIDKRIVFKVLIITYKALHGLSPKYISDLLTLKRSSRILRSNYQDSLRPPPLKPRTMVEKRSQCVLLAFGTISLGTYGIHLLWRHLKED